MTPGIWFSTSPYEGRTHWEQTYFPLFDIISTRRGEKLRGRLESQPMEDDHRALIIALTIGGAAPGTSVTQKYLIV